MTRRRWTIEVCTPLHERWMKGETIQAIAQELGASPHVLSRVFVRHGLPTPFEPAHVLATRLRVRTLRVEGGCRINRCTSIGDHRGMCGRHYQIARRAGAVEIVGAKPRPGARRPRIEDGCEHD